VQRSSISHILSGRNKPSLEFVLKVLSSFPDVELYWLMNGKGNFPKTEDNQSSILSGTENKIASETIKKNNTSTEKEIERIVIFYKDGSFSNFEN